MSYKTILVHVDEHESTANRLETAAKLAQGFDAHLAALYVACQPTWPSSVYGPMPNEALAAQNKLIEAQITKAHDLVEKTAKATGVSIEWRKEDVADFVATYSVVKHVRHADLLVIGQSEPDKARSGGADLPEAVVLGAGRPVLMTPYIGVRQPIGENVLVAWNGSREATRAVHDAMPLLEKAKNVVVMSVNAAHGSGDYGPVPGADIAAHLARHGVKVDVQRMESDDVDPGNLILSRISDLGSDLLVMGAYGRSRLREMILGGVSREVLRHMTVPVLLSH
ncbi:MAG: universal stress protein [Alphaproteobacteria bacterium]